MEIPGMTPFANQPTLTNPLSDEDRLEGTQPNALKGSETQNTVTAEEDNSTTGVVNQANEVDESGFNLDNLGGTIDITV